jgi:hypothetical protein
MLGYLDEYVVGHSVGYRLISINPSVAAFQAVKNGNKLGNRQAHSGSRPTKTTQQHPSAWMGGQGNSP